MRNASDLLQTRGRAHAPSIREEARLALQPGETGHPGTLPQEDPWDVDDRGNEEGGGGELLPEGMDLACALILL